MPTLYFAQGLPNGLLEDVAPVLFKDLGVDNTRITEALAYAAIPWVLKALWGPLVDAYGRKRIWIWAGQLLCALAFAGFAFTPLFSDPLVLGAVLLGVVAFASATHDVAADGFYLFGVPTEHERSFFSGIRNTAFRLAKVFASGVIVVIAGILIKGGSSVSTSWCVALGVLAVTMLALSGWHAWSLPRPAEDKPTGEGRESVFAAFINGWKTFFAKPGVVSLLAFILFFRLAEALLTIMAPLFMVDSRENGGLGLSTETFGLLNTGGVVALLAGGLLGGMIVSRVGLRRMLWPMVAIMHLPNLAFLALAHWQPENVSVIAAALFLEKFGYGFGFCAFMLYLLYVCTGERRVTHYAFCSGFMMLGAKLPGIWAGRIQEAVGYEMFFLLVMIAVIPGVFVTKLVDKIPDEFGRR